MLSEKEKRILEAIIKFKEERGYTPSIRQLCVLTAFASASTVHRYLTMLEQKGYIARDKAVARGIRVIKKNEEDELV